MAISRSVAIEHLHDGEDCINQCLQNLRRVQKNFPTIAGRLNETVIRLQAIREDLKAIAADMSRPEVQSPEANTAPSKSDDSLQGMARCLLSA